MISNDKICDKKTDRDIEKLSENKSQEQIKKHCYEKKLENLDTKLNAMALRLKIEIAKDTVFNICQDTAMLMGVPFESAESAIKAVVKDIEL